MNLSKPLTTTQGQSINPSSNNASRGVGASLATARRQRTRPRVHRVVPMDELARARGATVAGIINNRKP